MIRTIISINFQFLSYNLVQIYKPSKIFFSVLKSNCATLCFNHNSNLLFANHWKQQKLILPKYFASFFFRKTFVSEKLFRFGFMISWCLLKQNEARWKCISKNRRKTEKQICFVFKTDMRNFRKMIPGNINSKI